MALEHWVPAVSTTSLLVLAAWLFRKMIETRLSKSVEHEFDRRLESLRADLRISEEAFRAQLRAREGEVESLRRTAMDGLTSRRAELDKRRLDAIDALWRAFCSISNYKSAVAAIARFDLDVSFKAVESDAAAMKFFQFIAKPYDITKVEVCKDSNHVRPHVSDLAWALYAAYESVVWQALLLLHLLQGGLGKPGLIDHDKGKALLKAVLPQESDFIDRAGISAYPALLDKIEVKMLAELRRIAAGEESGADSVQMADRILREVERVRQQSEAAVNPDQ